MERRTLTRFLRPAAMAVAVAALGALISCTHAVNLQLDVSSAALRGQIAKVAAGYTSARGITVHIGDAAAASKGPALVIGWSFPGPARSDARPVPDERLRSAGFATARAFERKGPGDSGWTEVPVLWDAWGVASAEHASAPFDWARRTETILAPLGEPGVRQSLLWCGSAPLPDAGTVAAILDGDDSRKGPAASALFRAFTGLAADRALAPGGARLTTADIENMARTTGVGPIFGACSWLRTVRGQAVRAFRPLAYPAGSGYALPVSILSATVAGPGNASAEVDFLAWLVSAPVEKELSGLTGLMAASFAAPNLDANALAARQAAAGAASIVLIDPAPRTASPAGAWDGLLERVLARPADWERAVSGK